ncbi:hypothetical protein O6H91_11G016500 [Diphasiastrum complanatum]|uniref:Uncharacterized protein n=1 Tax=Diphasiastrum complanatum TaxID=34168 RepID=A0ACC2C6M8_DIPCM|nr:hypothetical protein O6H91_11G016500 [Diphasiastrum complanatum]
MWYSSLPTEYLEYFLYCHMWLMDAHVVYVESQNYHIDEVHVFTRCKLSFYQIVLEILSLIVTIYVLPPRFNTKLWTWNATSRFLILTSSLRMFALSTIFLLSHLPHLKLNSFTVSFLVEKDCSCLPLLAPSMRVHVGPLMQIHNYIPTSMIYP